MCWANQKQKRHNDQDKATLSRPKVLELAIWAESVLSGNCRCSAARSTIQMPEIPTSLPPQQKHLWAMNPYSLLFSNRLKALTCALIQTPIQSDLLDWLVLGSIYEP